MPDTFSKIYIHVVFAVKFRKPLIDEKWSEELYKYTTGIISNKQHKLLAINGMPDHIHILIGMRPSVCLSDLVREIKKATSVFIRDRRLARQKFEWQTGFGAFSCGYTDLSRVINYIRNQKEHHKKISFDSEWIRIMDEEEMNAQ